MKHGCRCECNKQFTRGPKTTRAQYAKEKVEHAMTCPKMWDWLKRSGKNLQVLLDIKRPRETA
jgi:hypothetical protein